MIFWALLSFAENALQQGRAAGYISNDLLTSTQIGQLRFMLVGLGLMLLMVFRPQGIFGNRREIDLSVRR
jgi:branched-chain amino acid transport system permease protein